MGERTAAEVWGEGSWQHHCHDAYAAGRCPRCDVELEAEGEWAGKRRCPRCDAFWGPQWRDQLGRYEANTMVIDLYRTRQ